jgi:Protein of unknown function (DUF3297)
MSDTSAPDKPPLPDHLSVVPKSPHHAAAVLEHEIGIRFNGQERADIEEYCISEGWIKPTQRVTHLTYAVRKR